MANERSDRTTIFFNSDRTFLAKSGSDIGGVFLSKGTWKVNHDTVMTSQSKLRLIDSIVMKSNNSIVGEIRVRILDIENSKPLEGVLMTSNNDNMQISSDNRGYASLKVDATKVALEFVGVKDTLVVDRGVNNEISLYLDFRNTRVFKISTKWKVKGKKLLPLDSGYSVFTKCN